MHDCVICYNYDVTVYVLLCYSKNKRKLLLLTFAFNLRQGNFHLPTFWFIDKTSCIVRILISVSANAFVHLKFLVKVAGVHIS